MRIYALAIAMALVAQPAWAHHKINHRDFFRSASFERVIRDPCALSHNPHQPPGDRAQAERCRRLLDELRATPDDDALRERCDRAARARTGRTCGELLESPPH